MCSFFVLHVRSHVRCMYNVHRSLEAADLWVLLGVNDDDDDDRTMQGIDCGMLIIAS